MNARQRRAARRAFSDPVLIPRDTKFKITLTFGEAGAPILGEMPAARVILLGPVDRPSEADP